MRDYSDRITVRSGMDIKFEGFFLDRAFAFIFTARPAVSVSVRRSVTGSCFAPGAEFLNKKKRGRKKEKRKILPDITNMTSRRAAATRTVSLENR